MSVQKEVCDMRLERFWEEGIKCDTQYSMVTYDWENFFAENVGQMVVEQVIFGGQKSDRNLRRGFGDAHVLCTLRLMTA